MTGLSRQRVARSLRSVLAGCVVSVALVWLLASLLIGQLKQFERDAAQRELSSLATLLADHTDRTLQGVDLLLSLLVGRVEGSLAAGGDLGQVHEILRGGIAGLPQVRRAVLLGADGVSLAHSGADPVRRFNSSDRPHFRAHLERDTRILFISDPLMSRIDDQWSIILSRRVDRPDGEFAGVVSALVDPEYLGALIHSAGLPAGTRAALVKRNGVILASAGTVRNLTRTPLGQRLPISGFDYTVPDLPARGILPPRSALGDERVGAYALGVRYPFFVAVSRPVDVVDAALQRSVAIVVGAAVLISLGICAIGLMLAQRLRSLEERFREGIERMPDGFMLWDAEDRLVAWNSRVDEILRDMAPFRRPGVRFQDYIRAGAAAVFRDLSPDVARAEAENRIERFRNAGAAWEFRDGAGRIVEVEEARTGSGGTVSIYRDVTSRRRQQEEVEKALAAEREANLVHRRFIAMASHEFRTPLAVIDGAAQRVLGQSETTRDQTTDRMKRIRDSVARMTRLIDRMLSSARLDEGRITVNEQSVDLAVLLRDVVGRQRQISAGFAIDLRLSDAPMTIQGDPQLLEQVFSNLLSNAVKYSGRSRQVDVVATVVVDRARAIEVAVTDRGIGIPEDEIDQLFTRFFRARTSNGISGTGIGLHLARELVALHGGVIAVRSIVGEGTTFTVRLPTSGFALGSGARDAA